MSGPDGDEIEVTVLGPGFGESLAIHVGAGDWILVDSCRNPVSKAVSVLDYLNSIGVDPAKHVRLVVVTHWHDDHLRGLGDLVTACSSAVLIHSPALTDLSVQALVAMDDHEAAGLGRGFRELNRAVRVLKERQRAHPGEEIQRIAIAGSVLLGPPDQPRVRALAPSSEAVMTTVAYLSRLLRPGTNLNQQGRPNANHASIVLWIEAFGYSVLLGADLQRHSNVQQGWRHIVSDPLVRPSSKADLVKIPHHGARSGHDDVMWSELLHHHPISLICPWTLGGRYLPSTNDVTRICGYSHSVYISSPARLDAQSASEPGVLSEFRFASVGRVTARRRAGEGEWRVVPNDPGMLLCTTNPSP